MIHFVRADDYPWLSDAFSRCTKGKPESEYFIHFVDASGPEWKFKESITLSHEIEGDLVVDVLEDHRIGGIEFLTRLIQASQ